MGSLLNDGLDIGERNMTKKNIEELEFETTSCYIAYDEQSGEILHIHECMKQKGTYEAEADPDEDMVFQMTTANYGGRNLKVMKLTEGLEMNLDVEYSIDTYSGELKESSGSVMTFSNFIKEAD